MLKSVYTKNSNNLFLVKTNLNVATLHENSE